MQAVQARRRWLLAARITPLTLVILGSLTWSSFSTFEYSVLLGVPAFIAWTLPLALDGTVAVTTPIWLSTVEDKAERNYAAWICTGALIGSMAVNVAGHGWIGIFCPLISYFLIHLVGRVLRAGAARMAVDDTVAETRTVAADETPAVAEVPVVDVPVTPAPAPVAIEPVEVPQAQVAAVTAPEPVVETAALPEPVRLHAAPPSFESGADVVRHLLETATAHGRTLPGGSELTRAVRDAGFQVNDNYGRTQKARWVAAREKVAV